MIETFATAFLAAFVGIVIGRCIEASHWRGKANPQFRTAMCSGGQFYYVMPEWEYCERVLGISITEHREVGGG